MVCPKSGRQGRQVQTLRSKEHSLENRTRCRSMLQPTKDRTTVIVEDNDLHVDVIIGVASEPGLGIHRLAHGRFPCSPFHRYQPVRD